MNLEIRRGDWEEFWVQKYLQVPSSYIVLPIASAITQGSVPCANFYSQAKREQEVSGYLKLDESLGNSAASL